MVQKYQNFQEFRILGPKPTVDFKRGEHQLNVKVTAKFDNYFLNCTLRSGGKRTDVR